MALRLPIDNASPKRSRVARWMSTIRSELVPITPGIAPNLAADQASPTSNRNLLLERHIARIRWLGIALGALVAPFLGLGDRLAAVYAIIATASLYNLVFGHLIVRGRSSWSLKAYTYGLFDIVVGTVIVGVTGGPDSPFYLVYFLVIVHAAIRFGRWIALLSSALVALCYIFLTVLMAGGGTPNHGLILLRIGFVAITALFAGFLADRARAAEAALAHQLAQARALNVAGSALTGSLEWHPVIQQIVGRGRALAEADAAILELRQAPPASSSPDASLMDRRATNVLPGGAHLAKVVLQSGLLARLSPAATGQVARYDLASAGDLFDEPARTLPQAPLLRAPLLLQGRWAGDLLLLRTALDRPFTEGDSGIIHAFMNQAALALENARLYHQVKEQAATDPITNLPNHRSLKERLDEELTRARRYGRELCVLMLDLDHFKAFNDAFGHAAGDEALRAVADALRRSLRRSDYAARYAGEEFVLVLPDTGAQTGAALAERVRATIAGLLEKHEGRLPGSITVSIGVAAFPAHARERESLLQAADFAMYLAKHIGRNQVCLATELGTQRGVEALFAQLARHLALPTAQWGPHVVTDLERRFARLASLRIDTSDTAECAPGGGQGPRPIQQDTLQTIMALATTIDAKDHYTEGHSRQVAALAVTLARAAGCAPEEVELVRIGGLLHDIGKIGIPESVLHKPSRLTKDEWAVMRSHADTGARILAPISALEAIVPLVRHHHEWWDGQGYPLQMRGEEIPLGARIIAICDAYDTMVSDRPYRRGLDHSKALARLTAAAGTQFDPTLVRLFVDLPADTARPVIPMGEQLARSSVG